MATAHDVAAYILARKGAMSTWKLQKLVYYSQAWHLVWADRPLFAERIEAWANGPVVRDLYTTHRGQFSILPGGARGDAEALTADEVKSVDAVLTAYGDLNGRQLSHLTHAEDPWIKARGGLHPTASSSAEITAESMAEYYGALDAAEDATPVQEYVWDETWGFGPATPTR